MSDPYTVVRLGIPRTFVNVITEYRHQRPEGVNYQWLPFFLIDVLLVVRFCCFFCCCFFPAKTKYVHFQFPCPLTQKLQKLCEPLTLVRMQCFFLYTFGNPEIYIGICLRLFVCA